MAGIYIHIPFCRQACHYCDFHFSTNVTRQDEMVNAIAEEIKMRKNYINEHVKTIYFGGGTPSLLSKAQLDLLLNSIYQAYHVDPSVEITLEANPEDLSVSYAHQLHALGFNRLSIGIQTFDEAKLRWMNRVHSSIQSKEAFDNARAAGFSNISLDLIYAIPDHSNARWEEDLRALTPLSPEHISLYGLTIEDRTVFGKWEAQEKLVQVDESTAARQYLFAIDLLLATGYRQYEVSNFGKEGFSSAHNISYWEGKPYLGVGPGAHSFDGRNTRRFNIRNNATYLKAMADGASFSKTEKLSHMQRANEHILTSLRTAKGLKLVSETFPELQELCRIHAAFIDEIKRQKMIVVDEDHLRLAPKGFLVADEIALRLFFHE